MKRNYWKIATIVLCTIFVMGLAVSYTYAKKEHERRTRNDRSYGWIQVALKNLKAARAELSNTIVLPADKSGDIKNAREYTDKAIESTERVLSVLKSMERKEGK